MPPTRRRQRKEPRHHGILLVDKPPRLTSHDVVDVVRRAAGQREVGHTGTLDPAATGLLVLCLGEATKLSEYFTRLSKVYSGTMRLGAVSDSHDADGVVTELEGARPVESEALHRAAEGFLGEIAQVPPMHSAKKIEGKRLYEYARAGEEIEVAPRKVHVHRFEIVEYDWPWVRFVVECGSGTYVRRLAHDLGEDLGCGAYLTELRRTEVGTLSVDEALTLDTLRSNGARGADGADVADGAGGEGVAGVAGGADDAGGADGADDAGGADGADDAGGADGADDAGGADGADDAGGADVAGVAGGKSDADGTDGTGVAGGADVADSRSGANNAASRRIAEALWPVRRALADWPQARLSDEGLILARRGHALPAAFAPLAPPERQLSWLDLVLLLDAGGHTLAVAKYVPAPLSPPPRALADYRGAWYQPVKQFKRL